MEDYKNFLLFFTMFVAGVFLEIVIAEGYYYFSKKHLRTNHYSIGKYLFLLLFPMIGVLLLIGRQGLGIVSSFLIFAVIGASLETLIGFAYHKVVGQRLWTFHKFPIWQYTSWLSLPIWGFIGLVFWLLAKII